MSESFKAFPNLLKCILPIKQFCENSIKCSLVYLFIYFFYIYLYQYIFWSIHSFILYSYIFVKIYNFENLKNTMFYTLLIQIKPTLNLSAFQTKTFILQTV